MIKHLQGSRHPPDTSPPWVIAKLRRAMEVVTPTAPSQSIRLSNPSTFFASSGSAMTPIAAAKKDMPANMTNAYGHASLQA